MEEAAKRAGVACIAERRGPPHCRFPGYAWQICYCPACFQHLGWLYTAVRAGLQPRNFWGFRRASILLERAREAGQLGEGSAGEEEED